MPGPMLGVAIDGSLKKGFSAGPLTVLGHGALELMLIAAIMSGLNDVFSNRSVAGCIGLLGGAFLAWMGYGMIKSAVKNTVSIEKQATGKGNGRISGNGRVLASSRTALGLILAGFLVSITNPYFIVWWASTGMESLRRAYMYGIYGVAAFFSGHIISDFLWYSVVSFAFSKGGKLINDTIYRWLVLFLGIFISAFSLYFVLGGLNMLFG
jgi:threonine/homoserine/homoserine lactone efflux protein